LWLTCCQWPSGHVGHLGPEQKAALVQFKGFAEKKGYYTPAKEGEPASHDEETLLRYLRARKFNPQEAFGQLKDTEDWRTENQLEKLYDTIDIDEYDRARRLYPQWTGRRDKRGIPFYVYEIGKVDAKDVSKFASSKDKNKQSTNSKLPWKLMVLFALYENLCRFVLPLCSAIPDRENTETPVSQSSNVVDLTGVGISKLWSLKGHMGDASNLATAHYPETLDRIFVVGTPSYFPTVWKWIQGWFDPITVSKIFILSNKDMKSTLEKYVALDNLPKKYGGTLDWSFGDLPYLEPEIADVLDWKETNEEKGHKTFPLGPIKLEYDESDNLMLKAIGTEKGTLRNRIIAGMHPDPGVAKLALTPGRQLSVSTKGAPATNGQIKPTDKDAPATNGHAITSQPITETPEPVATSKPAAPQPDTHAMNEDRSLNVGKDPHSALDPSSRAGTYTVPYTDPDNHVSSPPTDGRTGTSSTRFEQQQGTHAQGQLAEGTPQTVSTVNHDRPAVMDPNTVGQAPKQHHLPEPEEPQPSYMDQAKEMAEQAVEQAKHVPAMVMGAVGMGGQEAEPVKETPAKHEDPAVDQMSGKSVEEFLRSQTMSQPLGTKA